MPWRRETSRSLVSADRSFLGVALQAGSDTASCVVRASAKARRLDGEVRPEVGLLAIAALAVCVALDPVSYLAGSLATPMREAVALR